jgi:type IV secretion system protein VirB4
MIPVRRIIKDYRDAGSLDALVNVQAAVDSRTFLTRSGHLFTVLRARPVDCECLEPAQIDATARRFEAALSTLDERFNVRQYVLKRTLSELPRRTYEDPIVQHATSARAEYFRSSPSRLHEIDVVVVITYTGWRPPKSWQKRVFRSLFQESARQALSVQAATSELETALAQAIRLLAEKVDALAVQLSDVVPLTVLDIQPAFRFLRRLLNYEPEKSDAGSLKYASSVGFQAADSALECHRDHLLLDDRFVHVLSLKEPPARTFAHLLRALLDIPADLVIATDWVRENNARMRRQIQSRRRHFHNSKTSLASYATSSGPSTPTDRLIDDSAVAMVDDLGGCLEELEVRGRFFGRFSLSVVLYGTDRAAVQRARAECFKVFAAHDASVIDERYNLLNAWLAVLPGNEVYNLRRLWLLSTSYADLAILFAPDTGAAVNTHLGTEYLVALETANGTPYFLNLHHQDVAHTMVLGATGSGKSFLLNVLLMHLQKCDPLTFIFDLGSGYRTLTRLFGGAHVSIGSGDRSLSINPFCLPPTPENRHFLASFCRVLIESGGYLMTAADERDLLEQIDNTYAVEPDQRRLRTLARIVNRPLRAQLEKWADSDAYGRWFDNAEDTFTLASFQAVDFEGMDLYPDVLEPFVFYLLHRANAAIYDPALAGRFKVFVLDEAWRFFRHPAIKAYIVEALKTWRKKNAALILATQSVDDLRQSALLPVVVESCATKLFLANPGMDPETYRAIFHLNEVETRRIASLVPKKELLLKRPDIAKVLTLNVDPETLKLFGAQATASPQSHTDLPNLEILAGHRPAGPGVLKEALA